MKYISPLQPATLALTLLSLLPSLTLADENCIKLTGDKRYTWAAFGDFSGSGQIDSKTHCFPSGSGAISIGAPHASSKGTPGNTRLECHFPSSETDADFYNCNLSLVDGFSAAVTCSVQGSEEGGWPNSNDDTAPLGCGYDLLASCPAEDYDEGCKCCKNRNGAVAGELGGVSEVFQKCGHSEDNPNSAEVFHSMEGAYKFQKSDFPITCHVGKGEKVKGKRAVDKHHEHAHAHLHKKDVEHVRAVRSRSLEDALRR